MKAGKRLICIILALSCALLCACSATLMEEAHSLDQSATRDAPAQRDVQAMTPAPSTHETDAPVRAYASLVESIQEPEAIDAKSAGSQQPDVSQSVEGAAGGEVELVVTVADAYALEMRDIAQMYLPVEELADLDKQLVLETAGIATHEPDALVVAVTYRSDELLSCLIEVDAAQTRNVMLPVTFIYGTGEQLCLADFFTVGNTGWKGILADIVTEAAANEGMTLLCDVPPVEDTHPFFILDGNIVLFYRPYEITTYEAGSPCFILPMQRISTYMTGAYGIGGNTQ